MKYLKWNIFGKLDQRGWQSRTRKNINSKGILSSTELEKFCVNLPGPSGKAKYYWETDSEPVPWGKGEKNFYKKSEIVPETIRLQAVGASLRCDGVPFA